MWMQIAQMGLNVLSGAANKKLEYETYKSQRILDKAEVNASNKIREANNELGNAQASLTNWMRSVSNKRLIEAAGEQYNAMGDNLSRMSQQATTGSLQRRVQAAEQMGALTAQAAAAGVGGSTVDLINGSLRLRNAMLNEEIEKQEGNATYDMLMQRAGVMDNGYSQWDYSYNAATSNFMSTQMPIRVEPDDPSNYLPRWNNLLGVAGNLFGKGNTDNPLSGMTTNLFGGNGGSNAGGLTSMFGGMFGGGAQQGPQTAQGINPMTARPSSTTGSGYTFMGLNTSQMRL